MGLETKDGLDVRRSQRNFDFDKDSRLYGLPPAFTLVFCSAYLTLKMEAIYSSEKSVDFQRTTWYYIPEDSTLDKSSPLRHLISSRTFLIFWAYLRLSFPSILFPSRFPTKIMAVFLRFSSSHARYVPWSIS
jgi:hypothetical protein